MMGDGGGGGFPKDKQTADTNVIYQRLKLLKEICEDSFKDPLCQDFSILLRCIKTAFCFND